MPFAFEPMNPGSLDRMEVRKCANIKSRKHKNVQCTSSALNGDFCSRHTKNPIRFIHPFQSSIKERVITRTETKAVRRLQTFWRRWSSINRYKRQGPSANIKEISQNTTEVYSLEPITTIPSFFFFSFADSKKCIWSFDIRSLSHLVTQETDIQNPYTRDPIPSTVLNKVHERIIWLRARKYSILYTNDEVLTQQQIWNQKVLDVFFKMEHLGYRASCRWFDGLTIEDHEDFYTNLYLIWYVKLGLTKQEKEAVIPGYQVGTTRLFKNIPDKIVGKPHDLKWWRRTNLNLILVFLTRATQKSQQSLGALYVLMSLVQVVPQAADAYPWILETVS